MAAGDVIGTKECSRCKANGESGLVTYKESKGGGAAGRCGNCGRQSFDRSPKAVGGLKKFLEAIGLGDAGGAKKGAAGDALDISKL